MLSAAFFCFRGRWGRLSNQPRDIGQSLYAYVGQVSVAFARFIMRSAVVVRPLEKQNGSQRAALQREWRFKQTRKLPGTVHLEAFAGKSQPAVLMFAHQVGNDLAVAAGAHVCNKFWY